MSENISNGIINFGPRRCLPTPLTEQKKRGLLGLALPTPSPNPHVVIYARLTSFCSPRMYKSRLKTWDLLKNAKKDDWGALAVLHDREKRAGKHISAFNVRGRRRTIRDLQKYVRSLNLSDEEFLARQDRDIDIPDYISPLAEESTGGDIRTAQVLGDSPSGSSATLDILTPDSSEGKDAARSPVTDRVSSPGSVTEERLLARAHLTSDQYLANSSIYYSQCNSVFSEMSQESAASLSQDGPLPTGTPCDQVQRDLEVMGYQIISPVPLPSRIGSPDIESWMLVNAHSPSTSSGNSPSSPIIEFECSRCHQPASGHFASLERLVPSTPPQLSEQRSILNPSEEQTSSATITSASWRVANPTRYNDGAWKWPSRCFLACIYLTRGNEEASAQSLADASSEFEKMLISEDPLLLTAAELVAAVLSQHDQGEIARQIMESAAAVARRLLPPDNPVRVLIEYLTITTIPGALESSQINSGTIREVYEQLSTRYGPTHPYAIEASYSYAWTLKYEGDNTRAEEVSAHTYQISCAVFGPKHLQSIFALATHAGAQWQLKKNVEAIKNLEVVIANAASTLGMNHPYTLEAKRRMALILREEEENAQLEIPSQRVEALYRDVLWGKCRTLGRTHQFTRAMKEDYQEVCEQRGTWVDREADVKILFAEVAPPKRKEKVKRGRSPSPSDHEEFQEAYKYLTY